LPIYADIDGSAANCILPNGDIFYFGNDPLSNRAFIIDQNNKIRDLPHGQKANKGLNLLYHDGYVFAIGGENCSGEKFNLKEKKWESIAEYGDDSASWCCLFKDLILIVSYLSSKIMKYDINSNTYTEFCEEFLAP